MERRRDLMPHANLLNRRIQEDDEMMSGAPQPQRQPHTHKKKERKNNNAGEEDWNSMPQETGDRKRQ